MGKYSMTEEEWRAHLDRFGVTLMRYACPGAKSQATLTLHCRTCGTEEHARADNLIRRKKHPCPSCAHYQFYTTENIKELIEVHGGIYLGGEVSGKESEVRMVCPGCGSEVTKTAHDVRRSPAGCRECRQEKINQTIQSRNTNLEKARRIAEERGGVCLTDQSGFNTSEQIDWQCSLGHTWSATLGSVAAGSWCPHCGCNNRSENLVRALLEGAFGQPFPRIRPEFLQGLELDCYNSDLKLAVEVDGIQHFEQSAHFHSTRDDLERQQANDLRKRNLCRDEGVTLINVPYDIIDEGTDATRDYLANQLNKTGVTSPHDLRTVTIDPRSIYDMTLDPTYRDFVAVVEQKKGHFQTADYLGISRKVTVTCEEGHRWTAYPYSVLAGHWCPHCSGNHVLTLDQIHAQLKEQGWSLDRSQPLDYRNAHKELPMICACGQHLKRSWNKWQQRRDRLEEGKTLKCLNCLREKSEKEFYGKMADRGFVIVKDSPTPYQGQGQDLSGICIACGQERSLRVEQWKNRSKAPCCGRTLPPYHRCHVKVVD